MSLENIDDLASDVFKDMPEVSEHAALKDGEHPDGEPVDYNGRTFNHVIHWTDDKGDPLIINGKLKLKPNWKRTLKRWEKRQEREKEEKEIEDGEKRKEDGVVSQTPEPSHAQPVAPEPEKGNSGPAPSPALVNQNALAKAKMTATLVTGMITNSLAKLDGKEWFPVEIPNSGGVKDIDPVNDALAEWMAENDIDDLPAGVALVLAVSMYSYPRMVRERNGKSFLEWFSDKWKRTRAVFKG